MVLELKQSPTLQDFQSYVRQMKLERGFNTTDKFYECCLFAEEAGEVISAVRKNAKGGSVGSGSAVSNVAEELADVFIYVCSLANMHGIDLEQAFRDKEEKTSRAPGNGYRQQSELFRVRLLSMCGTVVMKSGRSGCRQPGKRTTWEADGLAADSLEADGLGGRWSGCESLGEQTVVRRGSYGSTFCRSQSRISLNRRADAAELRRSTVIFCAATILAREISGFCR